MEKKVFEDAELNVICFGQNDVIATSAALLAKYQYEEVYDPDEEIKQEAEDRARHYGVSE